MRLPLNSHFDRSLPAKKPEATKKCIHSRFS